MRVLVTGGTGFIGSHAVEAFVGAGHHVQLLARTPAKARVLFEERGVEVAAIHQGDMTDRASVRAALEGCDAVLHAAAAIGVATGATASTQDNLEGTRVVVGEAVEAGCDPVLYTSSVAVLYPPSEPILTPDSPLAEPISEYGRSKQQAEQFVRQLQAEGAPVVSFLIGGVYGPDQPQLDSSMLGIVAAASQAMVVTPGGVGIVDVRDLGRLFTAALVPGRGPRRYLAAGRWHSWAEWTDLLSDVIGKRIRRVRVPPQAMLGLGRVLDVAKRVRPFDYPLTYEAALYMTSAVRHDDPAIQAELGVEYRPTRETIEDSTRWLIEAGHLDPKHTPALAP